MVSISSFESAFAMNVPKKRHDLLEPGDSEEVKGAFQ